MVPQGESAVSWKDRAPQIKDLAEHCRTVAFALVVSAAAIGTTSKPSPPDRLVKALDDARTIRTLFQNPSNLEMSISKFIDREVQRAFPSFRPSPQFMTKWLVLDRDAHNRTERPSTLMHIPSILWRERADQFFGSITERSQFDSRIRLSQMVTIEEFGEVWDSNKVVYAFDTFLPEKRYHCTLPNSTSVVLTPEKRSIGAPTQAIFVIAPADDDSIELSPAHLGTTCSPIAKRKLQTVPIDMKKAVSFAAAKSGIWGSKAFKEEFAELLEASKSSGSRAAFSVETHLADKIKPSELQAEFLGVKIRVEDIALYAPICVMLIQLYLLSHLTQLSRQLEGMPPEHWPLGYASLYDGNVARSVSVATVCLIPILAMARVVWCVQQSELPTWQIGISWAMLLLVTSLAAKHFHALVVVWRTLSTSLIRPQ